MLIAKELWEKRKKQTVGYIAWCILLISAIVLSGLLFRGWVYVAIYAVIQTMAVAGSVWYSMVIYKIIKQYRNGED